MENRTSEGVKTFIFCSPSTLSVENTTSEGISARRGATVPLPPPPLCPCNKMLKPNFQPIISQTNNGCSLLSFILAKLLLLDISCRNIFALSVVPALTARPFSIKKKVCKNEFFYVKTVKIRWRLGVTPPDPRLWPLFAKSWVRHCLRARRLELYVKKNTFFLILT